MADGSDAIADWPLLNALVNTASGASWVSIHHGGGVGIGRSIHAGQVCVADGTAIAGQKIDRSDLVDSHALRLSSGVGVSWKSPMGPIKIDFGIPLMKDHYDERQVVHVSFGTKF